MIKMENISKQEVEDCIKQILEKFNALPRETTLLLYDKQVILNKQFKDDIKFRLKEEHSLKSEYIFKETRKKINCNKCYNRGYYGRNKNNELVPCPRCMQDENYLSALTKWYDYVTDFLKIYDKMEGDPI